MAKTEKTEPFLWIPGQGYSSKSLDKMCEYFRRPIEPMGEAWFMGETRKMYPELAGDLSKLSPMFLQDPLTDIISGNCSFGRMEEWTDWYHYLLPRLIPRSHERFCDPLLEYLLCGFFVLYPDGIKDEPYRYFRKDVLATLGSCMMDTECWDKGQVRVGSLLHRSNANPNRIWCWWDASGDFSASAFFCAKYLTPDEIEPWLKSMLSIRSAHWNAQVIVWLLGAHGMFMGKQTQPSELEFADRPCVDWEWSHVLEGDYSGIHDGSAPSPVDFLPAENREAILRVLNENLSQELFFEWLDAIKAFDYLEANLPSFRVALLEFIYMINAIRCARMQPVPPSANDDTLKIKQGVLFH